MKDDRYITEEYDGGVRITMKVYKEWVEEELGPSVNCAANMWLPKTYPNHTFAKRVPSPSQEHQNEFKITKMSSK